MGKAALSSLIHRQLRRIISELYNSTEACGITSRREFVCCSANTRGLAPNGELSMTEPEDTWPLPKYNPGSTHRHLHAMGVIAIGYSAFQRGMDELYEFHPVKQNVPSKLIALYYFSLNEDKRLSALEAVFEAYEKDPEVIKCVKNLARYFRWCKDCRDQLLHSEHYPAMFGGTADTLHLTKRVGKTEPKQGYMALSLVELRTIADKIEEGKQQCASVRIYLRVRGTPIRDLPISLRVYGDEPLPGLVRIPRPLKLSSIPPNGPFPAYVRKSARS
jgi:hypothetical protein